jgi:hypothetical protein
MSAAALEKRFGGVEPMAGNDSSLGLFAQRIFGSLELVKTN